jgi:hypothetical protein
LNQSIKAVLSNNNTDQFDPRIIELMFECGAQCINLSDDYNTLNIAITCSGRYIDSFKDAETKLIAERNAIKIIDIVIKHGARPRNSEYANTLSNAMKCANLNILNFLTNPDLSLDLNLIIIVVFQSVGKSITH